MTSLAIHFFKRLAAGLLAGQHQAVHARFVDHNDLLAAAKGMN
jgi:hypothetical protein